MFSKISIGLYLKFIFEKPTPFFAAVIIATCPFLMETIGILSLIPLLRSDDQGTVKLPLFNSNSNIELTALQMVFVLVIVFSLQWVFSTAKVFLSTSWSNQIIIHHKSKLFKSLQHKSPLDTLEQNKGVWLQLFQSEFRQLTLALISCVYLVAAFLFSCFTLWLLWSISPSLSIVLVPLALLIYLSIVISNKFVHNYANEYQNEQQNEASFLLEHWKHPVINRLHQTEVWIHKKYQKILKQTQQANYLHFSYTFSAPHWTRWVIFMCILALLATHYIMPIELRMSTQTLITYLIVLSRLQPITYTLSHDLANLVTGQIAWKAIDSLQQSNSEDHDTGQPAKFEHTLQVNQLTYQYQGREEQLGPFQLSISKGETFGIFGPSGSGKSTLMHCLMGIYPVISGSIHLDEMDYSLINKTSLWNKIAYVPQDSDFFQMSLKDNLCLGKDYSLQEIEQLCEIWGLKDLINTFPHQYDEILYPDAKNISGGQKKKIMMVRALLRNPEILFLDEPCTGLDKDSKDEWILALKNLPDHITTIIITHDQELMTMCDRTVELNR